MISDGEVRYPINSADLLVGQPLHHMMQYFPLATGKRRLRDEFRQVCLIDRRIGATHAYHCGFGQDCTEASDRHGIIAVNHRQKNPMAAAEFEIGLALQKKGFAGC